MFFNNKRISISSYDPTIIYSPISGSLLPIEKVDDSTFSQKLLGDGIAIDPIDGNVYSPIKGKVVALFPTNHAIGLESESGARVIVHIGINTVHTNGKGFKSYVNQGDTVDAGQLLIKVDFKKVGADYSLTTMIVIENSADYDIEKNQNSAIKSGQQLLKLTRKVTC